ncbi:amidase [Mycobacterium hackensackense]|uniref:amidase n=1 Tax=Mycobacterium hackensackense TaxID=228909 RepID=UPI002265F69F|nr:amidase [Mycobacterium hackensackense]MCV7256879.1 amidase [Mycobacterium hackensackense]
MTTDQPLTLTEAAAALRAGTTTSRALTEAALAAADRADPHLGVYVHRLDEDALAAADTADAELTAGRDRGPLHGIPFGVKDHLATAEAPIAEQSLVLDRAWGTGRDAPVVTRLKAAGAVITGKTSTTESACGLPDGSNSFSIPRNPWDPTTTPGGSSSGTGAGVAAGLFLAGLGTDTAGSIRIPAAFCGVSGLMPTFGRVPKSGCVLRGYSLDRIGPLARSAADCAAVLEVIAGPHPSDPDCVEAPFRAEGMDGPVKLAGLRVGVVREGHFPDDADAALSGAFDAVVDALAAAGAHPRPATLPYRIETITAAVVTMICEALAYHRADTGSRWTDYSLGTRALLARGALLTGADYVQAQRMRRVSQDALRQLFTEVDVLVCPTISIGAPALTDYADNEQDIFAALFTHTHTGYWNSVGNPVLALPMGFTAAGLPLSVQLAGRPFDEATLLRAGRALQSRTDWHRRTPTPLHPRQIDTDPAAQLKPEVIGMPERPSTQDDVRALLRVAELPASDAEVRALATSYPALRAAVDTLAGLAEVRYADPALRFRAEATITDWV